MPASVDTPAPAPVLVALLRIPGYEDVHPELVVAAALDHQTPWPHSLVHDEGLEVERPEDHEDASPFELARKAINSTWWPAWRSIES